MFSVFLFLFLIFVGYLFGSICSAVIVSRVFSLPDPRTSGSNNPGATNVLRLSGKKYAAMVLLGDMLKGLLPVLFAKLLGADPITISFTCLAAVMGHMYPIFFDFRGGKGVATALGGILGLHFILGIFVIATWFIIVNITRYASLASMASLCFAPIYALFIQGGLLTFPPLFLIAIFIVYKHRDNITRLIDGNEPKIRLNRNTLKGEIDATLLEQDEEKTLEENNSANEEINPTIDEINPKPPLT